MLTRRRMNNNIASKHATDALTWCEFDREAHHFFLILHSLPEIIMNVHEDFRD